MFVYIYKKWSIQVELNLYLCLTEVIVNHKFTSTKLYRSK